MKYIITLLLALAFVSQASAGGQVPFGNEIKAQLRTITELRQH